MAKKKKKKSSSANNATTRSTLTTPVRTQAKEKVRKMYSHTAEKLSDIISDRSSLLFMVTIGCFFAWIVMSIIKKMAPNSWLVGFLAFLSWAWIPLGVLAIAGWIAGTVLSFKEGHDEKVADRLADEKKAKAKHDKEFALKKQAIQRLRPIDLSAQKDGKKKKKKKKKK